MNSITTKVIYGKKVGEYWHDEVGQKYQHAEDIALRYYKRQGFAGTWCEGVALSLLLKAASLPIFIKIKPDSSRYSITCTNYYNLCRNLQCVPSDDIAAAIMSSSFDDIRLITKTMLSNGFVIKNIKRRPYHSNITVDHVLSLWNCLGKGLIARIATKYMTNPIKFKDGWPDLTITSSGRARFVEVKTKFDCVRDSQKLIESEFAEPFCLDFSVVKVTDE